MAIITTHMIGSQILIIRNEDFCRLRDRHLDHTTTTTTAQTSPFISATEISAKITEDHARTLVVNDSSHAEEVLIKWAVAEDGIKTEMTVMKEAATETRITSGVTAATGHRVEVDMKIAVAGITTTAMTKTGGTITTRGTDATIVTTTTKLVATLVLVAARCQLQDLVHDLVLVLVQDHDLILRHLLITEHLLLHPRREVALCHLRPPPGTKIMRLLHQFIHASDHRHLTLETALTTSTPLLRQRTRQHHLLVPHLTPQPHRLTDLTTNTPQHRQHSRPHRCTMLADQRSQRAISTPQRRPYTRAIVHLPRVIHHLHVFAIDLLYHCVTDLRHHASARRHQGNDLRTYAIDRHLHVTDLRSTVIDRLLLVTGLHATRRAIHAHPHRADHLCEVTRSTPLEDTHVIEEVDQCHRPHGLRLTAQEVECTVDLVTCLHLDQ
jgi:hypothetical protein